MLINSLYQLSGRYFLTWNCVPVKGLKITVRMRHCSDKNVNFSCLFCWGWYSDKQTNTVYPAYTGVTVDQELGASGWAHRAVLESKWELKNVQMRAADSPRGSSPRAPSTVSPKYLPPPLGVRPLSPLSRPCCSCVPLSKHIYQPGFLFLRWACTTSWRTWGCSLGRRESLPCFWTIGTETWGSPPPPRSSARPTSQKAPILGRCTLAPRASLQRYRTFQS